MAFMIFHRSMFQSTRHQVQVDEIPAAGGAGFPVVATGEMDDVESFAEAAGEDSVRLDDGDAALPDQLLKPVFRLLHLAGADGTVDFAGEFRQSARVVVAQGFFQPSKAGTRDRIG